MQWHVVGHEAQKTLVEQAVQAGKIASVSLYSGPRGIGKRLFAYDVIRQILGSDIRTAQNPDVCILEPRKDDATSTVSDIAVEDVRRAKDWAYQRPLYGSSKILLIDEAHRMGEEAATTFLKLLEEPPQYVVTFLITSMPDAILPTVRSRCQSLAFLPLSEGDLVQILHDQKLKNSEIVLLQLVANGSPGSALEYCARGLLPEIASSLEEFRTFCTMQSAERLLYTKNIADDELLEEKIRWWLFWARRELLQKANLLPIATKLLDLVKVVAESKHNRRIALDAFALELPRYSW